MRFAIKLLFWLALMGGMVVSAQRPGRELQPSNLDPPPKQAMEPPPAPPTSAAPQEEQPWSIFDYVDPADPRFYAKLGLLLGSLLLARKAYRQMKPH